VSFDPFGRSDDLAALAADGFELELTGGGHLLVKQVPYRTHDGQVERGTIVTKLELDGDMTVKPVQDHTVRFIGSAPCNATAQLRAVIESADAEVEPGLVANHNLSSRPDQPYADYHAKVTAYVGMITSEAQALDPTATAHTFGPCVVDDGSWPFEYVDTASGRAGIGAISGRLADHKIAIVGLGGTGSYILDLVAKCPVNEIHLFDRDKFSTHNAFRAPGAADLDELRQGQLKVTYLKNLYSKMKRHIVEHPYDLHAGNAGELHDMSFVFLAIEGGTVKRELVTALEDLGVSFVDCSLGVVRPQDRDVLLASVEINASTPENRATVHEKVDFGTVDEDDPYADNIQIAELNALNAVLAVLWWKKHAGIYYSPTRYHHQRVHVPFSRLINE